MLNDIIHRAGGHAAVAKLLGVDRSTTYRWTTGARRPTLAQVSHLLEALGASDEERLAVIAEAEGRVQAAPPPSKTRMGGASVPVGRRNPQARKFAEGAAPGGRR